MLSDMLKETEAKTDKATNDSFDVLLGECAHEKLPRR